MLDRIDSGDQRVLDARPGHGVRGHFVPQAMRFIDDRFHLLGVERRDRRQRAVLGDEVRAVGVDLDPVRAVCDLLANRFARFIDPVDDLHAHRIDDAGRVTARAVAAGDRHGARGDHHARPVDDAVGDGVLDVDVGVHRPLGLEIAHRREAIVQRDLHCLAGAQRAVRQRFLEKLCVVILGGDVALQQRVDVRVDQAGQQRHVAEVDHLRVRGNGAADRLDLVAADHDRGRRDDIAAAAVD